MVSPTARPYIDASVPVLREHGLTITRTFYRNMFASHPDLENLFNMGNQASGVQQQSLAAAVFAYAANIDNAQALGPVVSRIVQKHVSVGIKADHYPIVGRHLLGAIQETLGEAATPALMAAWDEAYSELADALIKAEKNLYAQAGIAPGQFDAMRVLDVHKESEDVSSFTLQRADGTQLPEFKPGQYVSVAVNFDDGRRQIRQYSLSDAPKHDRFKISVKREKAGVKTPSGQVSNWLHDEVEKGSTLQVSHPFGDFVPNAESAEPIVLLSAGIGITPFISVLNRIIEVHPTREVIFGHAARDSHHHAHQTDIEAAKAAMPNLKVAIFYESTDEQPQVGHDAQTGLMDISKLPDWARSETNVYLCGPLGFMKAQWRSLLEAGVPAQRLHREVFGPEMLDYLN